jgi:hypothetical protein
MKSSMFQFLKKALFLNTKLVDTKYNIYFVSANAFILGMLLMATIGFFTATYIVEDNASKVSVDDYSHRYANAFISRFPSVNSSAYTDKLTLAFRESFQSSFYTEDQLFGYKSLFFSERRRLFIHALAEREAVILSELKGAGSVNSVSMTSPVVDDFLEELRPKYLNWDYVLLPILAYILFQNWLASAVLKNFIYELKSSSKSDANK